MKRIVLPRLSLLTTFSLVSFVMLAAIAAALAFGLQGQLEQSALWQEGEIAADQVKLVLQPHFLSSDLTGPLSAERFAEIDKLVRENVFYNHIVRVKVWNPQGVLLYSDDKALVGQKFPLDEDLAEALEGALSVHISSLDAAENVAERAQFSRLIEVYVPLTPADSNQVGGAFEIYHDMTAVDHRNAQMAGFVWTSVPIGFAVLYASLFALVSNASRTLRRRSDENARLYEEATRRLAERIRADERLQRQLQRLDALRTIDIAITGNLDLRVTLATVLDQVISQLRVDAADILLMNPNTQTLEYGGSRGFRSTAIAKTRQRLGEGLAGTAAQERRMVGPSDFPAERGMQRANLFTAEEFIVSYAVPLIAKGHVQGVLEVFNRAPLEAAPEWVGFLEALAGQAAIAVDNAMLFANLQRTNIELGMAYDKTIEGWSKALDLRDKETEGHSLRVTEVTMRLAQSIGLRGEPLLHIRRGALLHDIGKMGVPDNILLKPGPLTDDEWRVMRMHPQYAYDLLAPITFLQPALYIPYCHHEKWDGSGYPRKLKGEQIPLAARIFAVVDVWDALCSDRPYRPGWPPEKVRHHLQEQAGSHFDPRVVEAFLKLDLSDIHREHKAAPAAPILVSV